MPAGAYFEFFSPFSFSTHRASLRGRQELLRQSVQLQSWDPRSNLPVEILIQGIQIQFARNLSNQFFIRPSPYFSPLAR